VIEEDPPDDGDDVSWWLPDLGESRIDSAELEATMIAVYAAQLPIPLWWPPEERRAFIEDYASHDACMLMSELDDIVDRAVDWAARSRFSDEERSARIATQQQAVLDEARSNVRYDLTELIADKSAELIAEAVYTHPSRRTTTPHPAPAPLSSPKTRTRSGRVHRIRRRARRGWFRSRP
jgi:hypothetical protein